MTKLYIIEFRFLVPEEPSDMFEALDLVKRELDTNGCAEEYIRWREFKEKEEEN
jgi:hypothetical protein